MRGYSCNSITCHDDGLGKCGLGRQGVNNICQPNPNGGLGVVGQVNPNPCMLLPKFECTNASTHVHPQQKKKDVSELAGHLCHCSCGEIVGGGVSHEQTCCVSTGVQHGHVDSLDDLVLIRRLFAEWDHPGQHVCHEFKLCTFRTLFRMMFRTLWVLRGIL